MPDPGMAPTPAIPDGEAKLQRLQQAGFTGPELVTYKQQQSDRLRGAGFSPDEIGHYWGDAPPKSATLENMARATAATTLHGVADYVRAITTRAQQGQAQMQQGMQEFGSGAVIQPGRSAVDPWDVPVHAALGAMDYAGGAWTFMTSAAIGAVDVGPGRLLAKVPLPGLDANFKPTMTPVRAGFLGDATSMIAGAVVGNETAEPAAISLPARAATIQAVARGELKDPGHMPAAVVGESNVTPQMQAAVPAARDYARAAGALTAGIGTEAASRVTANMHSVWVETGLSPAEQLERAKTDPAFKEELLAQDVNGDPVTPHFTAGAKPEHPPLTKAGTEPPPKATLSPRDEAERPPAGPVFVPSVDHAMGLLRQLEDSGDLAVSPAGAVGRYQIMPGTARTYDPNLRNLDNAMIAERLKDPAYNEKLARIIVGDLYRKYQGNMDAIAIAYNAGPRRANEYLTDGPGTRLEAIVDKEVRGGVRYVKVSAEKDESFLPLETQKYLANGRRRAGGPLSAEEGAGGEIKVPHYDAEALPQTVAEGMEGRYRTYSGEIWDVTRREDGGYDYETSGGAEGTEGKFSVETPEDMISLLRAQEAKEVTEGETIKSGGIGAQTVWDDAPIEDAQREVLSNIGEQPSMDWSNDLSPDAMADKLFAINPARRLDTALVSAKLLDRDAEFGIEDAFRQTFASDNRANVLVRYGQIDGPEGKNIIPGSSSLWDAVKAMKEDGGNPDGFRAWLMSKRTVDKQEQGIDTGVNPFAAARIVADTAEDKKYKRAGAIWTEVLNSALDYAQKAGRYSADQVAAMKALNPTYVSFRRIMGDDKSFQAKSGYGFTLGNPLKKMEGSDKQIVDPLLASVDNMRLVMQTADQNWARGHVVALAEANPEVAKALGMRKEGGVSTLTDEQVAKILEPYRAEMGDEELKTAIEALKETADESLDRSLADNQFAYYRDGQREVWTVDSPEFAQMLRGSTDRASVGFITKVFQVIAAGARSGIVIMPDFPLRNAVSHQVIQFINDPSHPPPFMAPIKGLMDVVGASDIYQDAMAKGAMGAAITDLDRDYLATNMAELFHETGVADKVWNLLKSPFEAARWLQERSDALNRVGLYKFGQENGLDAQKAAMRSRTAGIDYAEKLASSQLRWWARITPFFKARLLYLNQAAQAWKEHPGMTAAFAVGAVSLPATTMWAINQWQDQFLPDDRKFANIPRWEKDYALITPEIDGVRLKIRYPEGTGWLFGAMVTRALDAMAGHDPEAMHDWWQGLLQQLPIEAPPAIQTPLENAANYNVFTGQPMVPGALTQANTDMKYTENTTPVARRLSKLISPITDQTPLKTQFSPIAIDHLVSGWTGIAGLQVLKLVGAPFSRPGPPMDVADLPVIKGFIIRNPGFSAQAIEDYYTEKARFDAAAADVSAVKRNARAGDLADLAQAQCEFAMARADYKLNQVSGALSRIRSSIYGIYADKTMTDDEKRQHMEAIYVQEIQIAKSWTQQMREMDH